MKRFLALLLALIMIGALAACGAQDTDKTNSAGTEPAAVEKDAYTVSDKVDQSTVVDGVMTDISSADPILKKSNPDWLDTCVMYEVNIRQYTEEGTFAAFEGHLDRLKEMGVNTLWLMPIHPISEKNRKGSLGSYYAVTDYRGVNPEFGTLDDFKHLLTKAHEMGFKVMLDWVANHTGWDCAWIKDHDDWYVHNKAGEITSPYDWTDTAELNYDNYAMRAEMIDCMRYWVEDIGVDGFRCDHVQGVPVPFWNAAVYKLKSANKNILMLAECSSNPNLTQYAFDLCYNDALYSQSVMLKGGLGADGVKAAIPIGDNYAEGGYPMNYMDNHDKNSYEGSIVFRFGDGYPLMQTMAYLAPGIPLIYTSDEQGYDHEIEFFEKDAVKWDSAPKYAAMITALSKMKTDHSALYTSNTDVEILDTDGTDALAFKRTKDGDTMIFVANTRYEAIKGVTAKLGVDKATCIMHYDGKTVSTDETEMTAKDFEKKDYLAYEFYVLVVKD